MLMSHIPKWMSLTELPTQLTRAKSYCSIEKLCTECKGWIGAHLYIFFVLESSHRLNQALCFKIKSCERKWTPASCQHYIYWESNIHQTLISQYRTTSLYSGCNSQSKKSIKLSKMIIHFNYWSNTYIKWDEQCI